jgi:AcrR family transcriptional regulator
MYDDLMPRQAPPDRLEKILAVAATAFVEHGFHRTQMDDIASALGVSKGTVYRSVVSKEALLVAVLDYGDTPNLLPPDGPLPAHDLQRASTLLQERLGASTGHLDLTAAVMRPDDRLTSSAFANEVERIVIDLYNMMRAHRVQIMVLDRCAPELPELRGDWYEAGRYALVDLWSAYLEQRATHVAADLEHEVLSRTIVELLALWAVKMPWDPAPRPHPTDMAPHCAAMIRNLITGSHHA